MARAISGNDSTIIAKHSKVPILPGNLDRRLDSLQKADQLAGWLNTWYDYFSPSPSQHIQQLALPFNRIWRKPATDPERVALFYLLILCGYYQLQYGNILQSTDLYEQAYELAKGHKAIRDSELLDYLIKPLGNNYTRLGDYKRALYIQQEGLRRAVRMNDSMQQAAALANLSTTARWNDLPKDAIKYARQGLQKVKAGSALQGLLFSTLADILQAEGSTDTAQLIISKALALFSAQKLERGANNTYWYGGALCTAAAIARQQKQYGQAISLLRQAKHLYDQYFPRSRQREKMKVLVSLGQVYKTSNNFNNAFKYFNLALAGLLPNQFPDEAAWPAPHLLYAENTLLDAITGKAQILHLMGKDSLALMGYQSAAIVLQKLRTTIFSVEAKRLLQQQSLQTTEEAISIAYHLFQGTDNKKYAWIALQFAEAHKARLLLDDLQKSSAYSSQASDDSLLIQQKKLRQVISFYIHSKMDALEENQTAENQDWQQKIEATKYELSLIDKQVKEKYPAITWDSQIDINTIISALPPGMIAWEYFTGPDKWYGFSINNKGILSFTSLNVTMDFPDKVAQFVHRWFSNGPEQMVNNPALFYKNAFYLYQRLGLGTLNDYCKLLIIPDGVLGRLPFEALTTDSNYHSNPASWPYLLQKAETSQAYSLAVWTHSQKQFATIKNINGFSGFFINPTGNNQLATLNGVDQEAKSIHNQVAGLYYKNTAATAEQLLKALQQSEVVHISTHAILMGDKQIPALQMADMKILLADLYPLQAHPSLVFISACQTAGGLLSPGEGIISLAREFTAMGAGGVIAALWNINDETASKLTALYYKNLQETGDKSGALYLAKKQWLTTDPTNATAKLPYYWAGLLYYGNNTPLAHPLRTTAVFPVWGWGIIIALLLLLFSLIGWRLAKRKHDENKNTYN
ncbi:hypothetical protein GCM10027566_33950 [Arachidicoccus ginsenosidivorans]